MSQDTYTTTSGLELVARPMRRESGGGWGCAMTPEQQHIERLRQAVAEQAMALEQIADKIDSADGIPPHVRLKAIREIACKTLVKHRGRPLKERT